MQQRAKRWLPVLILFLGILSLPAMAKEYLVGTTATAIPAQNTLRTHVAIQNNGPNPIWCEAGPVVPTVGTGHQIKTGGDWFSWKASDKRTIRCICNVAQVAGAGTDSQESW